MELMDNVKDVTFIRSEPVSNIKLGDGEEAIQFAKGGTRYDALDMARMGKKQELKRNFRFISIVGFIMILQSSWESILLVAGYGLQNGGTGGVIWVTTAVLVGVLAMVASIAEMISMAPTAGGQYHWVSEFSPPRVQKPLSYLIGWMACLGWVTGCPPTAQLTSTLLQGLVLLKNNNANITALYQTTLLVMLFLVVSVIFNVYLARFLPVIESVFLGVHVVGYFVFLIVLWVTSQHSSAKAVFTTFVDEGGWGNQGLSCLVGITTPLWCFLGPDAGAHMSEELKDSSRTLPSALMWATLGNVILGLTMLITLCFCIGDVDDVLNSPTGIPIIQLLYNSTGSYAATIFLTVILILLYSVSSITCIATSSRQMWAFARDRGFPFSSYIQHVHPGTDLPINAIVVLLGMSLAITALNFGSPVALNAIISLSNAGLLVSYITSISLIRLKRLRNEPLLPRRWSLGRWGGPINDVALVFLVISFVLSFFPTSPMPDPADMNWAVVIFTVAVAAAGLNYYLSAHKYYVPPVRLVKGE